MSDSWISSNYQNGLVSVIIPTYNRSATIAYTLKSVLNQTYRPIEIIVVDDGSTDDTYATINEYEAKQEKHLILRYLLQNHKGAQVARNLGCRKSRGEFIQFLDSDDWLRKDKLLRQINILKEDTAQEIGVVYGDSQYLVSWENGHEELGSLISMGPTSDIISTMLRGKYNPSFSYLYRRKSIITCGPWDEELQINQDGEYVLRMAAKGVIFVYCDCLTGFYRKWSKDTISEKAIEKLKIGRPRINERIERLMSENGKLTAQRKRALAENYRRVGRMFVFQDQKFFHFSMKKALQVCPDYLPEKRLSRWCFRLLGLERTEMLKAACKKFYYLLEQSLLKRHDQER